MVPWYTLLIVAFVAFCCGYAFRGFIRRKLGWLEHKVGDVIK